MSQFPLNLLPARRSFRDDELEYRFLRDGYVVIDWIDEETLTKIKSIYTDEVEELDGSFFMSLWTTKVVARKAVDDKIRALLQSSMAKYFVNFDFIINSFAVKHPGPDSSWFVHQDDSFTDERYFTSASAWCALVDTDERNGVVKVLPGSHRLFSDLRAPTLACPFEDIRKQIGAEFMKAVPLKAGQALVFDHRLIHSSGPNNSEDLRLGVVSVMKPVEAPLTFYYKNEDQHPGTCEALLLDPEYYQKFPLGEKPEVQGCSSLGDVELQDEKIDLDQLRTCIEQINSETIIREA